jgi:hypothetical protein
MAATQRPTGRSLPTAALHELAHVERLLRRDTRCENARIEVGREGARVYYDTGRLNEHARGSLTASVVSEIVHTDAWGLATVHDPFDLGDEINVETMLTVVYDGDQEVA